MLAITDSCRVTEQAERGLRAYVDQVADELNVGPAATYCELAESATAYIALDEQFPDKPHRDLALVWDHYQGWALAIESSCGEDLLILNWYGPFLVPDPPHVAHFFKRVLANGHSTSEVQSWQHRSADDVHTRLAQYAPRGHELWAAERGTSAACQDEVARSQSC